ncbi:hypothetical protein [Vibrio anguillarum]|uniref:hypothetical protein n=1 Tax=Vibrio anguillarum TaxID=55601 RepID=UPI000BB48DB7|nr:hypothetical protein [Vibrio anguillarum]ATC60211.1 hypothetical protein CMV05_22740 [Vibrio anguillarum]
MFIGKGNIKMEKLDINALNEIAQTQYKLCEDAFDWQAIDDIELAVIPTKTGIGRMMIGALTTAPWATERLHGLYSMLRPISLVGGTEVSPVDNVPYEYDYRMGNQHFFPLVAVAVDMDGDYQRVKNC